MAPPLNYSIDDSPTKTLADVRALSSPYPELIDCPKRLAALLGVNVLEVLAALEALEVEGEVLA